MRIKLRKNDKIAACGAVVFLTWILLFLSWSHFRPPLPSSSASSSLSTSHKIPPQPPQKSMTPPKSLEKHLEKLPFSTPSPTPEKVQQEILSIAADTQQKDPRQAIQDLAESGKYLQKKVSSHAIDQISQRFQQWQKLPERATEPEFLPPAGNFDFETAQVHDVERFQDTNGKYKYTVLLFDSHGRTFRTEITGAEGESLWKTMQLIKKNPLMEKIYRTMVIPLLDEMIQKKTI